MSVHTNMNTYIDIWSCQSSDLGTLQHYCTMLCGYFHSGSETRAHLSDCVNEKNTVGFELFMCVIDTGGCVL